MSSRRRRVRVVLARAYAQSIGPRLLYRYCDADGLGFDRAFEPAVAFADQTVADCSTVMRVRLRIVTEVSEDWRSDNARVKCPAAVMRVLSVADASRPPGRAVSGRRCCASGRPEHAKGSPHA
jgi:hypothetical protein